jgi:hypothetical protein
LSQPEITSRVPSEMRATVFMGAALNTIAIEPKVPPAT